MCYENVVTNKFHSFWWNLININTELTKEYSILSLFILELTMELTGWTKWTAVLLITAYQRGWGKVMFLVMSVHQSVSLSMGWGSLVTITHDVLLLTVKDPLALAPAPSANPGLLDMGLHCIRILPSASDIWWKSWRSIQMCSLQATPLVLISGGIEAHKVGTSRWFLV